MELRDIKTFQIGDFGSPNNSFWMAELENLLLNFPQLESKMIWDVYCLIFIEKGEGEIIIEDKKIRADEPKVLFIKPRQYAAFDIARKSKGKIICFKEDFFSLRFNNNILYSFSFMKHEEKVFQRLNENDCSKVKGLCDFMYKEYTSENAHKTKIIVGGNTCRIINGNNI